jgi:hypothetical protein
MAILAATFLPLTREVRKPMQAGLSKVLLFFSPCHKYSRLMVSAASLEGYTLESRLNSAVNLTCFGNLSYKTWLTHWSLGLSYSPIKYKARFHFSAFF